MRTTLSRHSVITILLLFIAGIACGSLLLWLGLNSPHSAVAKAGDFQVTGSRPDAATPSLDGVSGCTYDWRVVSTLSPGSLANYLNGVAVIASDNIWAAGSYSNGAGYHTLIEQWNGTAWIMVPSPNLGTDDQLYGIAAVSANDIWAVGNYTSGRSHTFTLHWDGSAWTVVPSPDDGQSYFYLEGVSAISANNVWAVGFYQTGSNPDHTLALHWDGSTWSTVTSPNFGSYDNVLLAIATVAANDIWATGYYGTGGSFQWQPLIEHWDGTQWNVISNPTIGSSSLLDGIAVISANDIWAAGNSSNGAVNHTLIEHWNGTTWSIVASPNVGTYDNYLHAVRAFSSSNAWAVGYYYNGSVFQTLAEHWDGTAWSVVATPTFPNFQNELRSVAFVSADDAWAVGIADPNTLAEHYSYECVTGTPSATPTTAGTATPTTAPSITSSATSPATASATPTNTATPSPSGTNTVTSTTTPIATTTSGPPSDTPTNMPTGTNTPAPSSTNTGTSTPILATPTTCTLSFTDVPPGSTFYPYVRCLACLGIINGYADGTFKPNNNVTRGQLSKIVSNAAGFLDNQTTQMFQDVPVGSTFQVYIGRLASRGYINGYSCGGAGEPCVPPANLPYFRPNNNATRGQISKIDANAAGYSDPPSGQDFEDVSVGSTYYTYTFRLVSRGVMGGYQCGGLGEPCVPPGNLPYFRPNNNATRGQTSKIVANTFFPDCSPPAR